MTDTVGKFLGTKQGLILRVGMGETGMHLFIERGCCCVFELSWRGTMHATGVVFIVNSV